MLYTKYLEFLADVKRQEEILFKSIDSEIHKEFDPVLNFINQIYDLCISNEVDVVVTSEESDGHLGQAGYESSSVVVEGEGDHGEDIYWEIELIVPKNGDITIKELSKSGGSIQSSKLGNFLKILDQDFTCTVYIELDQIKSGKKTTAKNNRNRLKKEIKSRFPFTKVKTTDGWNGVLPDKLEFAFKKSDL
jgi:hypothetical protein